MSRVLMAAAALLLAAEPVLAAGTPFLIYLFPGAMATSTSDDTGVQTVLHCTNRHPTAVADFTVVARNDGGEIVSQRGITFQAQPRGTETVSTAFTRFYGGPVVNLTHPFLGSLEVWSSLKTVHCVAQVLDAANRTPFFITNLPATRFNQEPTGEAEE